MVWYIDPVYRTQTASSKPWKLLEALHAEVLLQSWGSRKTGVE